MKTENTRSRAGIHIPEFRRSLPAVFFWGRRGGTGFFSRQRQSWGAAPGGSVCSAGRRESVKKRHKYCSVNFAVFGTLLFPGGPGCQSLHPDAIVTLLTVFWGMSLAA